MPGTQVFANPLQHQQDQQVQELAQQLKIGVAEARAVLSVSGWNFEEAAKTIEKERNYEEFTLQAPDDIKRFEELKRNKPSLFPAEVKVTVIDDGPPKKSEYVWSYQINNQDPEYFDTEGSFNGKKFKRLDDKFSDQIEEFY